MSDRYISSDDLVQLVQALQNENKQLGKRVADIEKKLDFLMKENESLRSQLSDQSNIISENYDIPVKKDDYYTFYKLSSEELSELVPEPSHKVEDRTSSLIDDFALKYVDGSCILKKYLGDGGDVTVPDIVTSIGNNAFYNCRRLTSITIPDNVTSIGINAFYNCTALKDVILPDGINKIEMSMFCNCLSLTSITIPDSVKYISPYAFAYCTNLKSITIPQSVRSIGDYAFAECNDLIIYCYKNSAVRKYAENYNLAFELIY